MHENVLIKQIRFPPNADIRTNTNPYPSFQSLIDSASESMAWMAFPSFVAAKLLYHTLYQQSHNRLVLMALSNPALPYNKPSHAGVSAMSGNIFQARLITKEPSTSMAQFSICEFNCSLAIQRGDIFTRQYRNDNDTLGIIPAVLVVSAQRFS